MRGRVVEVTVSGILAGLYYWVLAPSLIFWTVDALTGALSLSVGPGLAALWVSAEFVFFLVPFAAIRLLAGRLASRGLLGALTCVAVFWLPGLVSAVGALAFGVPAHEYGGIGGAVASWPVLGSDVLASVIGLGLVALSVRGKTTSVGPAAAH